MRLKGTISPDKNNLDPSSLIKISKKTRTGSPVKAAKQLQKRSKYKLVVWDVDGPINHGISKTEDDCYLPPFRSNISRRGEDRFDFIIANKDFLKLTLDILQHNRIISVLGSQRIQKQDNDRHYGGYLKSMYQGMDYIFSDERPWLKEDLARKIGQTLIDEDLNGSKNQLLKAWQQEYRVEAKNIILVDDLEVYKEPAENAGHVFVHAPRTAKAGSVKDNAYLYETLLRTIPVQKIYQSIENLPEDDRVKNSFKRQFLTFQLHYLKKVTLWQTELVQEQNSRAAISVKKNNSTEEAAKQILTVIQLLILNRDWRIGFFGGEKIIDPQTGMEKLIPKGMKAILDEIEKAIQRRQLWSDTLDSVSNIASLSYAQRDHWFFNKRDASTQIFYGKTERMLQEVKQTYSSL